MKLVKQSYEIVGLNRDEILRITELAGRICYKSENNITDESAGPFIERLVKHNKHLSILRHRMITVHFTINRATSQQLLRHVVGTGVNQESQRYCNYLRGKFNNSVAFIIPEWSKLREGTYPLPMDQPYLTTTDELFAESMIAAEANYFNLLKLGLKAEEARDVLPNATKTEVLFSGTMEAWLNVFKARCNEHAQEPIRNLLTALRNDFREILPEIY